MNLIKKSLLKCQNIVLSPNNNFTSLYFLKVYRKCHNAAHLCENDYFKTNEINAEHFSKLISAPEQEEKVIKILSDLHVSIKCNRHPDFMTFEQLTELYSLETRSQRRDFLSFLFKKQNRKVLNLQKKEENRKLRDTIKKERKTEYKCDISRYGLGNNTLFVHIRTKSINRFHDLRVANAALFGEKIVLDLSYDQHMIPKERSSCASQLREVLSVNRKNPYPFDVHFCNANSVFKCVQYFKKTTPEVEKRLVTMYEGSYLDLFPKENLVYLSPHATETLETYDPNAIYIIGAFVDIINRDKISLQKSSDHGIKSLSLPLDKYIQWKAGTKSLTINQVFEIMLVLKNTGSWKKAFECVPLRKIHNDLYKEENLPENEMLQN